MNYSKIIYFDTGNARGISTVLFVSGCTHYCPQCFNQETWDFEAGVLFTEETMNEILKSIEPTYVSNFILSGGDPLNSRNIETSLKICEKVRKKCPSINIIVYTGNTMDEMKKFELYESLLNDIDIIIDGRYDKDLASPILDYRGSTNQKAWKNMGLYFKDISQSYFRYGGVP